MEHLHMEARVHSVPLARCRLLPYYCHSPLEVLVVQSLQRCQLDASGVKLVAQLLPQLEVQMNWKVVVQ